MIHSKFVLPTVKIILKTAYKSELNLSITAFTQAIIRHCSLFKFSTILQRSSLYSLVRSPHANKNSQEQFQQIYYRVQATTQVQVQKRGSAKQNLVEFLQHLAIKIPGSFFKVKIKRSPVCFKTTF